MTESDDTLLKNLLSEIEQLKLADLRKYFKQLYGFEAKGFRMETLRRRIAYRLQERRLGGLSKSDAEFLDRLADEDVDYEVAPTQYKSVMPCWRR